MRCRIKLLAAAVMVLSSLPAHAIRDFEPLEPDRYCGEGTIKGVFVGFWNGQGVHLEMDWASGRKPANTQLFSGDQLVRVLESEVGPARRKALEAASWLAFANGYHVRFVTDTTNSDGLPDCSRVSQIHMFKESPSYL